jgi:hypothetical protein
VSEFNEIFSASLSKFVVKTQLKAKKKEFLWNEETVPKVTSRDRNWEIFNLHNPVEEEHNSRLYIFA